MAKGKKTGGRKAGTPNKLTTDIKVALLEAFNIAGGAQYLTGVASNHPVAFCALLGKAMPTDANVTGNVRLLIDTGVKRAGD